MPFNIKELSKKEDLLSGGHRLCAGCGASIVLRQALLAAKTPVVLTNATGCVEVSTTIFPFTSWKVPWFHSAFENSAASISGIEAAYKALKRRGLIEKDIRFIGIGGDGGTYDIGFQALSGAMERGHRMLYICYDNGAYMNTGIQRSSATPLGAWTSTSQVGEVIPGKVQWRKNLTEIMVAHNIPYVAQASPSHFKDLIEKVEKALDVDGPTFINILSPCPLGWRYDGSISIELAKLAVETCFWPLYEVVEGKYRINVTPRNKKPVEEWLKAQGRFKHLFEAKNAHLLETFQKKVDEEWEKLQKKTGVI